MPDREDCYQILGVASDASPEDIKQAFRKKALDYHPDRVVGVSESVRRLAEEEMKKINRAYEVLKDPHKRRQYDSKWAIPKPVVDRLFIHFTDVEPGEIKRASFIIQNHGGSYKKLRIIYDPNSWVHVVHYESLTDSDELPLRVEIEAKVETWKKNYSEYIRVKLDEEETQVKIDLQTKPEPIREKVQPKRTPAARPTPPPSPGFPILGKWIVAAVSIVAIIAIFILMNGNWNANYVPEPPTISKADPSMGKEKIMESMPAPTTIGKTGPAGGLIFYDKGSYSDGWRYLEAAPKSTEWTGKEWGSWEILIGGTEKGIGTGQSNTTKIVTWLNSHGEADCAAQLCDALVYGGYSDWFLPSRYELNLMCRNFEKVGDLEFANYWSSSESSAGFAWIQFFGSGSLLSGSKYSSLQVRAVRAF